ncbi:MAG: T9SS type A sorting domain-containing protein [Muribaculaceae bacterium]
MKKRRKLIAVLLLMLSLCGIHASPLYFIAWFPDGSTCAFPFADHPVVKVAADKFTVVSADVTLEYTAATIHKFTISDEHPTGEVEKVLEPGTVRHSGDEVRFAGLRCGGFVGVYGINGVLEESYRVDDDGTCAVATGNLPKGMYIIKTETITYKFIKR